MSALTNVRRYRRSWPLSVGAQRFVGSVWDVRGPFVLSEVPARDRAREGPPRRRVDIPQVDRGWLSPVAEGREDVLAIRGELRERGDSRWPHERTDDGP